MTEIIKTKFLCKTDCSLIDTNQTPIFIKGKWYDGEYETWSFSEGYEINGGWRNYFVVNENGVKQRISRARFRAIFETCNQHLRDKKIEDILNEYNR